MFFLYVEPPGDQGKRQTWLEITKSGSKLHSFSICIEVYNVFPVSKTKLNSYIVLGFMGSYFFNDNVILLP